MANQLDNTESMYQNLYDIMMHHFHEENHAQSDKMAQDLLLNADLPDLIRARCHLVLATGHGNFLGHAQEAVRVLEAAKAEMLEDTFPDEYLQEAKEVLSNAQADAETAAAEAAEAAPGEAAEGASGKEKGVEEAAGRP